jgi:hypothetical protein
MLTKFQIISPIGTSTGTIQFKIELEENNTMLIVFTNSESNLYMIVRETFYITAQ